MKRPKQMDYDTMRREAEALVDAIKPLFADKDPMPVGAALSELVALLIAGHDANTRSKVFELHVGTVLELYPLAVEHFWDGDAPASARKKPKKEKP